MPRHKGFADCLIPGRSRYTLVHLVQNWRVQKPAVSTKGGLVVSQNAVAARIGAEALGNGGNAVDAVLATAFALAALEPWNSGLGGMGFLVAELAGAANAEVVDFGPLSPRALDPRAYPLTGRVKSGLFTWPEVEGDRNIHGPLSFAVPSAVRGYALASERLGRLSWRDLVTPAARLAARGLPLDWFTTLKIAYAAADLRRYEESRRIYLADGLPPCAPPEGETPRRSLGRLAMTLERLAREGAEDFYKGEIAAAILADVGAAGGVLSAEDLALCEARIRAPLEVAYRGARLKTPAGMTAGGSFAQVLSALSPQHLGASPDARYFTALLAALQSVYARRLETEGEGEIGAQTSTTHITAVDREGGIAALTTTLLSTFGSRFVLPQTGILMNNGILWFDPRPGRPNSIAPNKRALTNICPVIGSREGRPFFAIGASGGRRILPAVLQIASFIVDFGMDAERAAHHPRVDYSGGEEILIDRRLAAETLAALERLPGARAVEHTVLPVRFACPNFIVRGQDGLNAGIADALSPSSGAAAEPSFEEVRQ